MIKTLEITDTAQITTDQQKQAIESLENGRVVYLPNISFQLSDLELRTLLDYPQWRVRSKNLSYDPNRSILKQAKALGHQSSILKEVMSRYYSQAKHCVESLFPTYQSHLFDGRTSYRPAEIEGRKSSVLKNDTRLHVNAFSATPTGGNRILRVFCNINPYGQTRDWQLGEHFKQVVEYLLPQLKPPLWGSRRVLAWLKLTKQYRTLYDHYMLLLHNAMKRDLGYQARVNKTDMAFPPGSTWIAFSDQVSHAVLKGQFMLEQTFYLPSENMAQPHQSPQHILNEKLGNIHG